MAKKKRSKSGRPSIKITDEIIQQVEEYASRGLNYGQIAHNLDWNHNTLIEKRKKFPEFTEAIERGRAKCVDKLTSAAFVNATEMLVDAKGNNYGHPGGDPGMQRWLLEKLGGETWRPQSVRDLNQEDGQVGEITFRIVDSTKKINDAKIIDD